MRAIERRKMSLKTEWRLGVAGIGLCLVAVSINAFLLMEWWAASTAALGLSAILALLARYVWLRKNSLRRDMETLEWEMIYHEVPKRGMILDSIRTTCFWTLRYQMSIIFVVVGAADMALLILFMRDAPLWAAAMVFLPMISCIVARVKAMRWLNRFKAQNKAFGGPRHSKYPQ